MPGVCLVISQIHLFIRFVLGAGRENLLLVLSLQKLSVSTLEEDTILYNTLLLSPQIIVPELCETFTLQPDI